MLFHDSIYTIILIHIVLDEFYVLREGQIFMRYIIKRIKRFFKAEKRILMYHGYLGFYSKTKYPKKISNTQGINRIRNVKFNF